MSFFEGICRGKTCSLSASKVTCDGLAYKHELDDSTVTVSPWDVKEHSQLRAIITQPVYAYYNLKSMFDVIATDGVHFPVITENGDIFMVDRELRISETFPAYSL